MFREVDNELLGICNRFDSIAEMTEMAVGHGKKYGTSPYNNESWLGRGFPGGWKDVEHAMSNPWQDGLFEVQDMMEEIAREVPPPRKICRMANWNSINGDMEPIRALTGNPEYMREVRRSPRIHVPQNITVICNVGNTADWSYKDIFWRGAAGIAAVDLLEKAGYNCELWVYNLASHTFGSRSSLCCCRVKRSGEPLDIDTAVNGTSAWFFRTVIFELRKADPAYTGSKRHGVTGGSHDRLGGWEKYLDVENGVTPIRMPAVGSRETAILAAKGIIDKAVNGERERV